MEYVKIEDNIVVELVSCDSCPTDGTWKEVMLDGGIHVGDDIRLFDSNWELRPLEELVKENLIELRKADENGLVPAGTIIEKIKDGEIVPKSDYDFAKEGLIDLDPLEYLDDENEKVKSADSVEELLELKKITKTKAKKIKSEEIRKIRNQKLDELDSIILNPLRWQSFSEHTKEQFSNYRKDLLDVPQQKDFPWYVEWPELPKG